MEKPEDVVQMEISNQIQSLEDLKRTYLHQFPVGRAQRAVTELLQLVHRHCKVSPFDSTITYPNGNVSMSSLGQILHFFVCSKKISDMPPDAPIFLDFLKSHRFKSDSLCLVHMNR